ncbi:carboxypeptidase regulatory-like domain-containing protein [Candidatus Hydrogenedentota bacterium]
MSKSNRWFWPVVSVVIPLMFVCFLVASPSKRFDGEKGKRVEVAGGSAVDMPETPHKTLAVASSGHARAAASAPASDEELKQTSWFGQVQENIRKAEYKITRQEKCVIDGEPGGLHAANRANNLRAYFREDGLHLMPRETSDPEWQLRYQFTAWGRESAMQPIRPIEPVNKPGERNRVEYHHSGITEWYVNNEEGLEHGFTISQRPAGGGELFIEGEWEGLRARNGQDGILLKTDEGGEVLRYTKLEVRDATGAAVHARMSVVGNSPCIVIADSEAIYPLTVDPIYVPPLPSVSTTSLRLGATLLPDQVSAGFGYSVSGAGDVNGDGHADVIVGAFAYDNGEFAEGAVFLFWGSASGIQGNAPGDSGVWMAESNQVVPHFGSSVSGAGDVNGDGYADVIVGASEYDNGEEDEGATFVFLGSASGPAGNAPGDIDVWMAEGNQADSGFGHSVSGAGDVNGDGYDDIIVGADKYDNGLVDEGAAFVFIGSPAGLVGHAPKDTGVWMAESNRFEGQFGRSVSGAGDVNGDGYSDVIVGAAYTPRESGTAFVFHGSASGLMGNAPGDTGVWTAESNLFGASVSGAGDVNGDGYADIVVGASKYDNGDSSEGAAFVFHGSASGLVGNAPGDSGVWMAESNQAAAYFGESVSGAGDINGDGYADIVVGAPGYDNDLTNEGATFVFHGSASGLMGNAPGDTDVWMAEGNQVGSRFGHSVSDAGDINGDGYGDVIVAANDYYNGGENTEGAAFIFLGAAFGLIGKAPEDATVSMTKSNQAGAFFGESVSGAGDVNGDGYADVIVGASRYDNGEENEGAAFLFLSSESGLQGSAPGDSGVWMMESNQFDSGFGHSVSGAGDVNGDGYADVIVGASRYDNGEENEGAAFLFLSSESGLQGSAPGDSGVWMAESNQAAAYFGESVSGAGDVNGDGYADIIVGSHFYDNGTTIEGVACVFLGSASGLRGNAPEDTGVWMAESNNRYARFGSSVSGAGDVNGDGYGDVIVGAPYYYTDDACEGAAFVFLGSASGLVGNAPDDTGVWMAEGNQSGALFGCSVAGAGDVNSDGYDDVVVGAYQYNNGELAEGTAFVFLGSVSGLVGNAPWDADVWMAEGNQNNAYLGCSVSSAGDVNGDGYDDVIVGAWGYANGEGGEGAAFVFLGSASGLDDVAPRDTTTWMAESNHKYAWLGTSVSGAGDMNGDGYADVIVGASDYDDTVTGGGAFVFLGGNSWSMSQDAAVLIRPDGSYVATPGLKWDVDQVRLIVQGGAETDGWTPEGPAAIQLQWEIKPSGIAFDGSGLEMSADWLDPVGGTISFDELISVPGDVNGWHWRARVLHLPLNLFETTGSPGPVTAKNGITLPPNPPGSRWHRPQWATVGPPDFRTNNYGSPSGPSSVSLTPTSLTTLDDIVCTVGTPGMSPAIPPKPIQYEYSWSNGERSVVRFASTLSDTLSFSETQKHDTWSCTVRAWDGLYFSHASETVSTSEIENTPPGAPTVVMPDVQSTNANLIALITEVSHDPDIDPIQYDFDWYVKREGETEFTLFRDGSLFPSISSQVNDTDTAPGEEWYVIVTPYDGEEYGSPASTESAPTLIVQGGVEPSFISLAVSPMEVKLGQTVTALGNVFPTPAGTSFASFHSVSPSQNESDIFPEGTVVANGAYSRTFYPTEASEARTDWSLAAAWSGDETYAAATSSAMTFTVNKAQPTLALALRVSSVPLNYGELEATATITASLPGELSGLLAERTVNLYIRKPDNSIPAGVPLTTTTDENGVATFTATDFTNKGIAFDTAGTWQFIAEFEGDNNLLHTTSTGYDQPESVRLTVKDRAGYAVLVLGKLDEDAEGMASHAMTLDFVYSVLRTRGFEHDDIYYCREGSDEPTITEDDIEVDDTTPTQAEVKSTIETWAAGKMNDIAAPLFVVFVDHGSDGKFYIYSGSYDETRVITPSELDGYFDTLQGKLNAEALAEPIIFLNGSCYSGTFTGPLEDSQRIIVTSASADEVSHRGEVDPDTGVRDGEVFVTEIFRGMKEGKTLKESFELACHQTGEYTSPETNGQEGGRIQNPLLDDNGDGTGTTGDLSYIVGEDGSRAHEIKLGYGVNTGDAVGWLSATPTVTLPTDVPVPTLEAKATHSPATGHQAWIAVKTPSYSGGTVVDETNPDSQEYVDMTVLDYEPAASDLENGFFRWSDFGTTFDEPGTYKVFYYVKDGTTDETSTFLLTTVYRGSAANTPPPAVTLLYPEDDSNEGQSVLFAWSGSTDPDGDAVRYKLELATDSEFTTGLITRDNLDTTAAIVETIADGLQDLTTYYWRVIPVDEFGASPDENTRRTFTTNFTDLSIPGAITGVVRNSESGTPLAGVVVTLSPSGLERSTDDEGRYLFAGINEDTYTITVSTSGYGDNIETVVVDSGRITERNVNMVQESGLDVSQTSITLSKANPSADIDIITASDSEVSWSASCDSSKVTLSAESGTGDATITVSATDFSVAVTASLTVTNIGDPGNVKTITVTIAKENTGNINVSMPDCTLSQVTPSKDLTVLTDIRDDGFFGSRLGIWFGRAYYRSER